MGMTKEEQRKAASQRALKSRQARQNNPLWRIGGGPWALNRDCPAIAHNTLAAGRGQGKRSMACICPRGLALYETYKERGRKTERRHRIEGGRAGVRGETQAEWDALISSSTYMKNIKDTGRSWPDLSTGRCVTTAGGRRLVDILLVNVAGAEAAHRNMCESCPVRQQCLANAREREQPAGAWGGMLGGLTAKERQAYAAAQREQERIDIRANS